MVVKMVVCFHKVVSVGMSTCFTGLQFRHVVKNVVNLSV